MQPFGDLANAGLGTLFLKYGRDDELESDRLGAEYAVKAGWDPTARSALPGHAVPDSTRSASAGIPNWLSTHPDPGSRVVKAQPIAERAGRGPDRRSATATSICDGVDGLAYGDDPAEGVVRGHHFLHPDLRIGIDFPEGWEVVNSTNQVVARLDDEKALMVMQGADTARGGVAQ